MTYTRIERNFGRDARDLSDQATEPGSAPSRRALGASPSPRIHHRYRPARHLPQRRQQLTSASPRLPSRGGRAGVG